MGGLMPFLPALDWMFSAEEPTTGFPGLEWTLPANRIAWTLSENRVGAILPPNRIQYTIPADG